jgi:hypothetical protein
MTERRTILWTRLDRPGHESARLFSKNGWYLVGTSVFVHEREPCRLDYQVSCDDAWHTRSVRLWGWVGDQPLEHTVAVDADRRWRLNGTECPAVAGCIDIDLNWSPSTNLLPIRRLDLAVGARAEVRAAWWRFPSLTLEPLEQVYQRLDAGTYRYESAGGRFVADLEVDASGLVTHYPGFCRVEGIC